MLHAVGDTRAHDCRDLVQLFDSTFVEGYRTRLCGGAEEPVYVPAAQAGALHEIHFTRDYFASALHEVAHWCVAGPARREQEDYGYWYAPDGRSDQQQAEFERVEVRPQALEWLFARASGYRFRPSADNLAAQKGPSEAFLGRIHQQVLAFCEWGVSRRVELFLSALTAFYGTAGSVAALLRPEHFALDDCR